VGFLASGLWLVVAGVFFFSGGGWWCGFAGLRRKRVGFIGWLVSKRERDRDGDGDEERGRIKKEYFK